MSPVHAVPVVAPPHSARLCQLVPLRGYSMFVNTDLINTKPCQKAVILRDLPHKTHACAPNAIIISMLAMHPCIILTCSTHRIKTPFPCSCRSLKAHCNVRHASNILYLHVGNAYTRPLYACPIKTICHVEHADYFVMCISKNIILCRHAFCYWNCSALNGLCIRMHVRHAIHLWTCSLTS